MPHKFRSYSSRHFADPPTSRNQYEYDQFVPSYANESYASYDEMRPGYGSSPARSRDRSPPRGPRDRGGRDSRDRDRGRDRSRSPQRLPSSRPSYDERRNSSYQRPAQQSPRPSPLGNNGASASSPRPPLTVPKLVRNNSSPSTQQTSTNSPSSAPAPAIPVPSTIPAVPSVSTTAPLAAPTEVHLAIATTLGEIFKQFGEEAINTAILKQQKATAERELKKKRDDYNKGMPTHGKFPASEESQRKARDHAERQLKTLNKQLKEKDDSLKHIATSAASKIPNILGATSGGSSNEEHQKMRQNCDELAKRCNNFKQQLEAQKEQMDSERKAREQLEEKHLELTSQYKITQTQLGEFKTLQSKFEDDIRSQLQKEVIESQKQIQELKRGAASAHSDLSRVPQDLQQTLQRFDDLFKRLNGLPNVEAELQKIRGEVANNTKNVYGQLTPLIGGLDQAKSDIANNTKHIIDTAKDRSSFQEKLKEWKRSIEANVSAVDDRSSKHDYPSKQDFIALKQQVARIGSKPSTPPVDPPMNPDILGPLQGLQAKVTTLEKQLGILNFSKVENRVSACEENGKTYVKASKFNEALDEVADIKKTISILNGKWVSLNEKMDRQQKDTPTGSPFPDKRTGTPVPESRASSASLPANVTQASELKQRLSHLEGKLARVGPDDEIATQGWVKTEIELAHDVSDDHVGKEIDSLKARVNASEHNISGMRHSIGGIEGNVQNIFAFNKTISSLPGQVDALRSRTTPPAVENTTVVESAVAKAISGFDKKHTSNLAIVQQNLHNIHSEMYRPDGGVLPRIEGLGIAYTSLDSRISKISTLDLHQSMANQFQQEQFPQLQNVPNLETQVQATVERVSALEKNTNDASLSELRGFQETNKKLSDAVVSLETKLSNFNVRIAALETRSDPRVLKELRSETDRNTHDLGKLNNKMKNDFLPVLSKVVQLEGNMKEVTDDVKEVKIDTEKFQGVVAEKLADVTMRIRDKTAPRSAPSTSPFNNPNSSIRDRKTSTPIPNGTSKKRKLENGHSTHSSFSSTSKTNGASRGSSSEHVSKKPIGKRRRRNPEEDDDDDDEDYEDVKQPTIIDSDSDDDD